MAHTFDRDAAERRIAAYVDFLMASYDTDAHGLADIAGINRGTLTRFINAPYLEKRISVLATLARLTGTSLMFLMAEEVTAEGV